MVNNFFLQDVLIVAPNLLGQKIVRVFENGEKKEYIITEVEAYRGEEDLACHASKGKTKRNEAMYKAGGIIYVYLIYGMYWMLNFVCEKENIPQAVLIRSVDNINGPGRVGRELMIDKSFYNEKLYTSKRIWIENTNEIVKYKQDKRIGIDYAGQLWKDKLWRFTKI